MCKLAYLEILYTYLLDKCTFFEGDNMKKKFFHNDKKSICDENSKKGHNNGVYST